MNRRIRLYTVLMVVSLAPAIVRAEGTPAGTEIHSRAAVAYTMSGSRHTKASNRVSTMVAEVLDLTVTWQDAAPVPTTAGAAGAVLAYRLTNVGNGAETYALASDSGVPGDDFDPLSGTIHLDTDGDGRFDPAVDEAYVPGANDPELPADGFAVVFLRHDIPTEVLTGALGDSRLEARSQTGTGVPGTAFEGLGDHGLEAVVGASGGRDDVLGTFEIVAPAADLTILKSATVRDPYGGTQPVSGAVVTYSLAVSAQGTGTADGVVITDAIPANTTYNPGSLALDGSPLTDAADGDAGDVGDTAPGTLTVALGDLAAGAPGSTITFSVTIE